MNIRNAEIAIIRGLESYLSTETRPLKVVSANQTTPIPDYPYVAYTVTQSVVGNNGLYGIMSDGRRVKHYDCVISFTIQSDDMDEAAELAIRMVHWFNAVGIVYLSDNEIAVKNVGTVTNRDNLISVEYEYRQGLDVTFTLFDVIEASEFDSDGYIEEADVKNV